MKKKYEDKSNILRISNDEYLDKKEVLTSFFSDKSYVRMTFKQIKEILNVDKRELYILDRMLSELEQEGFIFMDDSKRYIPTASTNMIKCRYESKSRKFGFAIVENGEDIHIETELSLGAMSGDDVLVEILTKATGSKSREGKVVKILKRNTKKVIGTFTKNINFGFVEPIDQKIQDIYIPKKHSIGYNNLQMVEVEILKYATPTSKAEGRIINVVGNANDPNIEVKALYKSYGLDIEQKFDKYVLDEVEHIPDTVREEEKIGRVDKTHEKIYTIDGADAKDLDDAICIKKLNDQEYMLSVFIADVSYYVRPGTALDKEAIRRGTSTYIPGTVIPMLPKKLSNGICSLNEGVERLSLAIDMVINKSGKVVQSDIYKAVIKVTKKMTYDKVFKVLNLDDLDVLKEYKEYEQDIFLMKELALILNKKRKEEGSINFDIPETKVILNDAGEVIDIRPYDITIANKIIEEFMLVSNRQIAEKFFFLEIPFIYRIHERPDDEKLRALNEILSNYNKVIKGVKNVHPKTLSDILDSITDEEEKQIVSTSMLRTLKLAKYSNECLGHFGLSAKYYCHFTSPIRRYPDLFIHRVISDYIESGFIIPDERLSGYSKQSEVYSKSSSEMEKQATMIERDFDDLYKTMYMAKFINEEFDGVISSVTSFGLFVRLENTVEGLIPFDNMPGDDYYIFDEVKRILIGRKTGKTFKIGDKVRVELVKADVKLKQIDFKVIQEIAYEKK